MIKNVSSILMFILGYILLRLLICMIIEPSFLKIVLDLPFFIGYLLFISHVILVFIFFIWLFYKFQLNKIFKKVNKNDR